MRLPGRLALRRMCLPMCLWAGPAAAAGIAIMEQSVRELGWSFAGAATATEDGSAVYFNPGAMAGNHGGMFTGAGYLIIPSTRFSDRGSRSSPASGGAPLTGNEGGNGGVTTWIPNLYFVQQLSERWVFGLGVNSPFGVHSEYDPAWKGRYQAIESLISSVNVNPSLAIRLGEGFSIGAGINVQYFRARLTNAIDFGSVCAAASGLSACARSGLLPQQADGFLRVEGDSVGVGYDLGVLFQPTSATRLGVSYRSGIEQSLSGDADYSLPAQALPLAGGGRFADSKVTAPVRLPDSLLFGFHQALGERWTLTGDALWTHWSRIDALTIRFSSSGGVSRERMDWRDTWRGAVGLSYQPLPATTLRAGLAYDQSPISRASLRSPRIPDSDRVWLTAGISYRVAAEVTVHAAYAHLFFSGAPIRHLGMTGDLLQGQFSNDLDIVGLQMDWLY